MQNEENVQANAQGEGTSDAAGKGPAKQTTDAAKPKESDQSGDEERSTEDALIAKVEALDAANKKIGKLEKSLENQKNYAKGLRNKIEALESGEGVPGKQMSIHQH